MTVLKLHALDVEDLSILSSHIQDSVTRVGDIRYDSSAGHFTLFLRRFVWESGSSDTRRLSFLSFGRVTRVRSLGIDRSVDSALSLLSLSFGSLSIPGPPSGIISLNFSGSGLIELFVECIEVQLSDSSSSVDSWTSSRPFHDLG